MRPALIPLIAGCAISLFGQHLYLIAGSPLPNRYNQRYATVLARVENGTVRVEQELVPADVGSAWTSISYDHRKVVIATMPPDSRVIVLDLDAAAVVKSCEDPDGTLKAMQWLLDLPKSGLVFAADGADQVTHQFHLAGMIADPTVPCENSFIPLKAADLKYFVAYGTAGIGQDYVTQSNFIASFFRDGSLGWQEFDGDQGLFDYKIPSALFSDMKTPGTFIDINNRDILAVFLFESPRNSPSPKRRYLLLRKRDNTWHVVPDTSLARGFGKYFASSEVRDLRFKGPGTPESAGKAQWSRQDRPTGPEIFGELTHPSVPWVYPGFLQIYDSDSGKYYTINTKQTDSEILLVESSTVFYRITNRLYSAQLRPANSAISPPKLLATDDLILDAHWAFIRKP